MKHVFFELVLHLGFLLCHLGCRLTKSKSLTLIQRNGIKMSYIEEEVIEDDN